jgi:alkylhydroperoxidase/carboxymuconolactone decarboxylase family protein YurZ
MNTTTRARRAVWRFDVGALAVVLYAALGPSHAQESPNMNTTPSTTGSQSAAESLTLRQHAIVPIAAFAAAGDIARLGAALNRGLDAGLSISDAREILVQLYAYAGFPRSLNALGELMKVVEARKQQGLRDAPGSDPGAPIPQGDALLVAGTANQTRLSGAPVKGPLFDFAPAIDQYLKAHLFGDIFERDNLDWQSRELATVGMLSSLAGAEPQLQAHMRISMNVGLTAAQLREVAQVLREHVGPENGRRAHEALERQLAADVGGK